VSEDIKIDHYIRVRTFPSTAIIIHGPTDNWQHRPRANPPKNGYWVGPIKSKSRAEQVAYDLADKHGYEIELCKICYHDRQMPPPSRGEGVGGSVVRRRRQRHYVPANTATTTKGRSKRGLT